MQVNRTLQGLIYKYLTNNNTWRYIDSLQDLVKSYWKRIHSTIGIFPLDAEKDESAMYLRDQFEKRYLKIKKKVPILKRGDLVRITKKGCSWIRTNYNSRNIYDT